MGKIKLPKNIISNVDKSRFKLCLWSIVALWSLISAPSLLIHLLHQYNETQDLFQHKQVILDIFLFSALFVFGGRRALHHYKFRAKKNGT